jgi:hypothetical protein
VFWVFMLEGWTEWTDGRHALAPKVGAKVAPC